MRIKDFSPIPTKTGIISISDRIQGMLKFGFSWPEETKAQHTVIAYLRKALDNKYMLLRNVTLPDSEGAIPMILIGPTGLDVFNTSGRKGVYRATEDSWSVMDNRARRYKSADPNRITQTISYSEQVVGYLNRHGYELPGVEGVLIFTNPGTHVETKRPLVRIILVDALEKFADELRQRPVGLAPEDIMVLVDLLANPRIPEHEMEALLAAEAEKVGALERADTRFDRLIAPLQRWANFSKREWLLLLGIAAVEAVILIIFVILILVTA
jgi:hypothetical protein